jgi:hypothetical protein
VFAFGRTGKAAGSAWHLPSAGRHLILDPMARMMTRAELYALVWDRPITKLAAEFGLSDVGLRKIRRRHDVPTPPIGYWAKKASGKPVKAMPLPRPGDTGSFWFRERKPLEAGAAVVEALAGAKAALADWQPAGEAPTTNVIVERTVATLEAAKAMRTGLVTTEGAGLISVAVRPECVERSARILRLLADAAGRVGITPDAPGRAALWRCEGEEVSFSFEEVADRVAHEPTEQELRAVARWEAERQATFKRHGYLREYGCPRIPKWEERLQGRLAVRLEEVRVLSDERWWSEPIRRSFADGKKQDLVDMIPRVLATVAAIAVAKRDNRGVEERRRLAEEAARRERERVERRNARERARIALFEQLVGEHKRLLQFEACLDALEDQVPGADAPRARRLLEWAQDQVARVREQTFGAGLEARLGVQRLFGDEDEQD